MAPSHPLQLDPGARIGHYTVESLISSGGFGAVYRVTRDGRPFALKLPLTRAASDEARKVTEARIIREVVSLMSLQHPGIVGVHGFDRWPDPVTGALYLVMDFVDGLPLKRWREATSPSLREILDVFRQLALAVEAMHAMGVVHRDIKSSNVLVTASDGHGRTSSSGDMPQSEARPGASQSRRPVLVDFGLARPTFTTDVTAEHVVVGTEGALAPELLASSGKHFHYTPATDLYALGRLFFEVLTGLADPYFPATSVCGRLPRLPSNVARGLPPLVDPIVLDLLASDPARRTPSAAELARQLEVLLGDESWGDTLPVPARFLFGRSELDFEGRFITRAEGAVRATPEPPPASDATAEFEGAPTLPMFVLDPNETLAGVESRPPLPVGTPYPVAAPQPLPLEEVAPGALPFAKRAVLFALQALVAFGAGSLVWLAVLLLLSSVFPEPRTDDWADVRSAAAAPAAAIAPEAPPAPTAVQSQSRALVPIVAQRTRAATHVYAQPVLVRAALVGHAQPGPARAVLRQPVQLATASLPTGATLEGTADALPDGRFLLRFDSAPQANGRALALSASALVDARAAQRRPLAQSIALTGFEFDLRFATPDRGQPIDFAEGAGR